MRQCTRGRAKNKYAKIVLRLDLNNGITKKTRANTIAAFNRDA